MRILKTHVLLRFLNSYLVDSPQPANISYLWNFGSLLAVCLIIQILTGAFLAMHYTPNVDFAFNSVEHIMRDVNNGWLIRYTHANVASFFFIFVYMHIGRGLYYGSYKSPRVLVWSIGVVILVLMMANENMWPNCQCYLNILMSSGYIIILPFNRARTKSIFRIGPHKKIVLDLIICGLLGDFWGDKILGNKLDSIRFSVEQGIVNSAYIHYLANLFYSLGYCARPVPTLINKTFAKKEIENHLNYRLTLFTFTSLSWIYDSFYEKTAQAGEINRIKLRKRVPSWIDLYLTPLGLAHWIMQDGSRQKGQGISIASNSFTYKDCIFLANILTNKYNLKTSVIKTGTVDQWRISIWKESMPLLSQIVSPYIIPEMEYKLAGYINN